MFLDDYNFYASIFSPLWLGCGGLLCPVSACSVHLSCLTALGGLLYLLLHRVRPYTKFPSQSTPPGLCIASYLLFDTWSCPWFTSFSHLKVSSVFHTNSPLLYLGLHSLLKQRLLGGVIAWFSLFIAQLLGISVSFIIYRLENCYFVYFVLLALANGE